MSDILRPSHECEQMLNAIVDVDIPVMYEPVFDEFGIQILDGGTSEMRLSFCPWCGCRLPESKRTRYFELLDELDLEPGDSRIPSQMQSDEWWRSE